MSMAASEQLLKVSHLKTSFRVGDADIKAVDDVSFEVKRGDVLGIVGESGSGKSVTSRSIMQMITEPGRISGGKIEYKGREVIGIPETEMRRIRGKEIALIFQDPQAALNPVVRVGRQVMEALTVHGMGRRQAEQRAYELLERVGIPDLKNKFHDYPHQFSGGMRQRVVIAMALANDPDLLIADEPTTALDVTIQAQILRLIAGLREEFNVGIIFITHDMGVVAELCTDVVVMYGGRVMERGPVDEIFAHPKFPYTMGLLRAVPRLDARTSGRLPAIPGSPPNPADLPDGCAFHPRCPMALEPCKRGEPVLKPILGTNQVSRCLPVQAGGEITAFNAADEPEGTRLAAAPSDDDESPVLELRDVYVDVNSRNKPLLGRHHPVYAVSGVSLKVYRGQTLGLVGESGCGKSTLSRATVGIQELTKGQVFVAGQDVTAMDRELIEVIRSHVQYVFQDPYGSLNPRRTARQSLEEALEMRGITGAEARVEVNRLAELVGLSESQIDRFPATFSGGQRQRLGIARALAREPGVLILDEPVSALDVSIQAQIINLLEDLQEKSNLGYLVIAHDLAVVRHLSDQIAVMYLGRVVETGTTDQVYDTPQHPYTAALLSSTPIPQVGARHKQIPLTGDMPSPAAPPTGCRFRTRCPIGPEHYPNRQRCIEEDPQLAPTAVGSLAACHFSGEIQKLLNSASEPNEPQQEEEA